MTGAVAGCGTGVASCELRVAGAAACLEMPGPCRTGEPCPVTGAREKSTVRVGPGLAPPDGFGFCCPGPFGRPLRPRRRRLPGPCGAPDPGLLNDGPPGLCEGAGPLAADPPPVTSNMSWLRKE